MHIVLLCRSLPLVDVEISCDVMDTIVVALQSSVSCCNQCEVVLCQLKSNRVADGRMLYTIEEVGDVE